MPTLLLLALSAPGLPWRPFRDPIDVHSAFWLGGWTLLVPMAIGIAVIYKAVRVPDSGDGRWWQMYWRQVAVLSIQIVLSMIALAAAAYVFVEVYVRWIAGR